MHDMIWAAAYERALHDRLAEGRDTTRSNVLAVEYANLVLKAYGQAIMAGLPVRK
jgi:hypothetical protein